MGQSALITFIAVYIFTGFVFPYLMKKKGGLDPYYAVSISIATIFFVLLLLSRKNEWWKLYLASAACLGILPILSVFLLNQLDHAMFWKKLKKKYPELKSYLKSYDHEKVCQKAAGTETESWGFLRFRMNEVSYYKPNSSSGESVICQYKKPLAEERELIDLTDEFVKYHGPYQMSADEWRMANTIWHDERGAYRLMLIFIFDDQYQGRFLNEYAKIVDYPFLRSMVKVNDMDNENDHGFRTVVAAGGPRNI